MKSVTFLRYWIQDIIFVFIIISIIEILIPSSNMRKHINMVVGFLIIIVMISPFIKLLAKEYSMDDQILEKHLEIRSSTFKEEGKLSSIHEQQIRELYKEKMKMELDEFINKTSNYKVVDMNLYIDEGELGKLEKLELILVEKTEDEHIKRPGERITAVKIQDVIIEKEDKKSHSHIEIEDEDWLKEEICKEFNIPKDNITIGLNILKAGELDGKSN